MSKPLRLLAVGDVSLGDYPFCPGYGIRSSLEKSGCDPFHRVAPLLRSGDIAFCNLETVVSDWNLKRDKLQSWEMRGHPSGARLLRESGFSVINIANNHTMQHGIEAFQDTVRTLAKEKISVVGLTQAGSDECGPAIVECQGRKVGFLGYAFEHDTYSPGNTGYAVGCETTVIRDIKSLVNKVDYVVVSCHWGLEFVEIPSPNTVSMARKFIEAGAKIVLGHHAHVLQSYEFYKGGLILYGMGNFLFDMMWDKSMCHGAIFAIDIYDDKCSLEAIPTVIRRDYSIESVYSDKSVLLDKLRKYGEEAGLLIQGDIERKTYDYYMNYRKLLVINRKRSYLYFIKNMHRGDKSLLWQVLQRSLHRHVSL